MVSMIVKLNLLFVFYFISFFFDHPSRFMGKENFPLVNIISGLDAFLRRDTKFLSSKIIVLLKSKV